jgi:hypothetical protein
VTGVGEVMTNIGSGAWHVIEANKPSSSLASNVCNAVPDGVTDPMTELTDARGPNSFVWRMKMENAFSMDVVDISLDLRWDYGARLDSGGAYIPICYLYVPWCNVLWGVTVDVSLYVHQPTNAGTATAPMARLPLTVSGTISTLVSVQSYQWDFELFGDGSYHAH